MLLSLKATEQEKSLVFMCLIADQNQALLMSRLHIMVLHRYHNSVSTPMPDRLRNMMLAAGTATLETAVAVDTLPDLGAWAWYGGAYQQYHTAFLLLMEVYVYPHRKEADRIVSLSHPSI